MLPRRRRLAITAALEHYTATLAECLLSKPEAQALLGETEVRSLLLWHALEESEHKAVAFDVYRAAGGPEWLRIRTMRITSALFLGEVIRHTFAVPAARPGDVQPGAAGPQPGRSPALAVPEPRRLHRLNTYNRKGFHPDDWDATELIERWKAELFGTEGALVDHLR